MIQNYIVEYSEFIEPHSDELLQYAWNGLKQIVFYRRHGGEELEQSAEKLVCIWHIKFKSNDNLLPFIPTKD